MGESRQGRRVPSAVRSDRGARLLTLVGAAAILVIGYVHYYLYFEGGYREIAPENVLGLTVSRAFILNAIVSVVVAEMLVVSWRWRRLSVPAALAGIVLAASTLGAYVLTRTQGFLGFEETMAEIEAVIAGAAEVIAIASLVGVVVLHWRRVRSIQASDGAEGPADTFPATSAADSARS